MRYIISQLHGTFVSFAARQCYYFQLLSKGILVVVVSAYIKGVNW